jgi:hypothetical protein
VLLLLPLFLFIQLNWSSAFAVTSRAMLGKLTFRAVSRAAYIDSEEEAEHGSNDDDDECD